MNAREYFAQQHEIAEGNTERYNKAGAEKEAVLVLRRLGEFCAGAVDLSAAVFEDGGVTFPDGLRISSYPADDFGANGFRVQGQCPRCGETCWSGPCFTANRAGEMLAAFKPHDHRCPVPDERRPISVGDVVTVELVTAVTRKYLEGVGVVGVASEYLEGARVLATPRDGGGCWQLVHRGTVYAIGVGFQFLITRKRPQEIGDRFSFVT